MAITRSLHWEKMGFVTKKRDELTWGNKKSSVSVMEKVL